MAETKSETARGKLIRTTARLLRTKGYSATGLTEITAESGVPKGSLYHHFPGGKQTLAAASVDFSGVAILARLDALFERAGSELVETLSRFCDHYVEQLETSGFRRGCPLATVALETGAEADAVQQACANAFEAIVEWLAARLSEQGLPDPVARDRALFVLASIEGALLLAKACRSSEPIKRIRDQIVHPLTAEIAAAQKRTPR